MTGLIWTTAQTAILVSLIAVAGSIALELIRRRLSEKLEVIHGLVNSTLSASMQSDLDTSIHSAALMREVIALNEKQGVAPSEDTKAALVLLDAKIVQLSKDITDRNTEAMNFATRTR